MPIPTPISEEELVERLQAGDQAAVSILYDRYSPALYGIVLRIVRCEQSAEDVLQDCFVKVWRSVRGYDPLKSRLFTWLSSIARNAAIDAVRSLRCRDSRRTCSLEREEAEGAGRCSAFSPDHIGLEGLTHALSTEQREVIELLYFGGFTQAEAAEELNIPLGTAKTRARGAIAQLKKAFRTPGAQIAPARDKDLQPKKTLQKIAELKKEKKIPKRS